MGAEAGPDHSGAALLVAVLALLALVLLSHGALLLARQEVVASTAARLVLQARAGAEGAVAEAMRHSLRPDTTPRLRRVHVLAGVRSGVRYEAYASALGREAVLLHGVGRATGASWGVELARLAWVLSPRARVAAFGALVEVGPGSVVEILGATEPGGVDWDEPLRSECDTLGAVLDSIFSTPTPAVAALAEHPFGEPSLGRLGTRELLEALDTPPAATGTPSPVMSMGRCETDEPWNWGDPEPGRPCSAHRVGWATNGPLRLEGGVGQGLLVAEGPVDLAGTRFRGLIVAAGGVTLSGGASVDGLVRAYGGIHVDEASRISRGGCAALTALEALRDRLSIPLALPAGWVGPIGPPL